MHRAHEVAAKSGQKTITINHVQAALDAIGFAEWNEPLKKRFERAATFKMLFLILARRVSGHESQQKGPGRPGWR
jgi:hypothetical protein